MDTLLDLIRDHERLGNREALLWFNGFRTWKLSYRDTYDAIARFAAFLDSAGIRKGDRVLLWGENRPEWVIAFWGSIARGAQVVPVDYRFSTELALRIYNESRPVLVVHGDSVASNQFPARAISFDEIRDLPHAAPLRFASISPDDIVEIVYTSGTTGEPKGVVHRHRNIVANLKPFKDEIDKYKKWARPFQPIRILNLLPLSHMFGQALGLFIPLLLGGSIAFMEELNPGAIIETTRRQRISVLVAVPRVVQNLRNEVERQCVLPRAPSSEGWIGVTKKWWRYRHVHRRFGWKFWCFVVGGAHLEPDLEAFWSGLGFLVIQGYGLTETSPVIAVNHPFHPRRGSLGKPIEGQEVRIASDGEILVRGQSVVGEIDQQGWFHTGDIGEMDQDGRLYYKGRKKDVIVTPEGMNVYPEDVESALNAMPLIRESVVVSFNNQVHAFLILRDAKGSAETTVEEANRRLEPHQRIRSWSLWPDEDFPRTPSTMKVKRGEVANRVAQGLAPSAAPQPALPPNLNSLSSLERVDLLAQLEQRYGLELDEESFAKIATSEELQTWVDQSRKVAEIPSKRISLWAVSWPTRLLRGVLQRTIVLPLFRHYIPLTPIGLENLEALEPPVIFAANHTSHLDTPAIFAALPRHWRRRLAPAVRQEQFWAFFEPERFSRKEVLWAAFQYALAGVFFNTYPLPREMAGVRLALKTTGNLISRGYCPLVFPEGERTADGRLHTFQPGIGLMAVRLRVAVVPIFIDGLYEVYSIHDSWPKPGPVTISIGPPLEFPAHADYADVGRQIQESVGKLSDKLLKAV
jgi:long-chain acyl-CoA synthetase